MKILIYSWRFPPDVGGLEVVGHLVAGAMYDLGHAVTVVTRSHGAWEASRNKAYAVVERPRPLEFLRLLRRADVFLHHNISGFAAWPLLLVRRSWVISHHVWLPRLGEPGGFRAGMKRASMRLAENISVSEAVAKELPVSSVVIRNPYDDSCFMTLPHVARTHDVVFVGRLVSDKGVDVLLRALEILLSRGNRPTCTVVGDGPSRPELEAMAAHIGLADNVRFVGTRVGRELVELLNQHKIMVVPSKWEEPFGIVALEGIACGCIVLASNSGGLPEAVGPCGKIFPKSDHVALAGDIELFLKRPELIAPYQELAKEHLGTHSPRAVAERYLEVFHRALGNRASRSL